MAKEQRDHLAQRHVAAAVQFPNGLLHLFRDAAVGNLLAPGFWRCVFGFTLARRGLARLPGLAAFLPAGMATSPSIAILREERQALVAEDRFDLEFTASMAQQSVFQEGARHIAGAHAQSLGGTRTVPPGVRRALDRIYRHWVASLVEILETHATEPAIREALAVHARYHLSGLAALLRADTP